MKEITYVEPASIAKITGALTFGLACLWLIPADFFLLTQLFKGKPVLNSVIISILGLAIFPGLAYVTGILLGYMYNFVAKHLGGIEVFLE